MLNVIRCSFRAPLRIVAILCEGCTQSQAVFSPHTPVSFVSKSSFTTGESNPRNHRDPGPRKANAIQLPLMYRLRHLSIIINQKRHTQTQQLKVKEAYANEGKTFACYQQTASKILTCPSTALTPIKRFSDGRKLRVFVFMPSMRAPDHEA